MRLAAAPAERWMPEHWTWEHSALVDWALVDWALVDSRQDSPTEAWGESWAARAEAADQAEHCCWAPREASRTAPEGDSPR